MTPRTKINLDQYRGDDANRWAIPPFATDLAAFVMPLFFHLDDHAIHIGTACSLGGSGWFVTAKHCVEAAVREHGWTLDQLRDFGETDAPVPKMSVLQVIPSVRQVSMWFVERWQFPVPTDLAFGFLHTIGIPPPILKPTVSLAIPRRGERLRAVGYPRVAPERIDMEKIRSRTFDWRTYQPELVTVEGQANAWLTQRAARGWVEGPCLITSCPTEHGMSGGAVMNESGCLCGMVSASHGRGDGSLISLLYPALIATMRFTFRPASNFAIHRDMTLLDALREGLINTDGSEQMHGIVDTPEGIRIDPRVHESWKHHCFEDLNAFGSGTVAKPIRGQWPNEAAPPS